MKETVRLIKVFLASPGDLTNERCLAKESVDEINKRIAPYLGFRVELLAWEDTLPGSGRPQDIINQELDLCELFIGMMWRKWGTPPAIKSVYSSGFEEEFQRSCLRRSNSGQPEIAMFFKEVDQEFLQDPGDDLRRVIEFKNRLISEKTIFFKEFQDSKDLQKYVREKLEQYLINLSETEARNQEEQSSKPRKTENISDKNQSKKSISSPFSAEGHSFLENFLRKIETEDSAENIIPQEVARFRLLSSSISRSGNDVTFLGVHDANIIYSNKMGAKYSTQEISSLIDCGLKNITHENAPLWYWLNIYKAGTGVDFLIIKSLSNEEVSIGAFEAMKLIGTKLPTELENKLINRVSLINSWLDGSSDDIKSAALRYLKHHGKYEDLSKIQSELDQANPKTASICIEAIVSIQLRYNKSEALKTIFIAQFELFDEALLEKVLSVSLSLDNETLRLGLKHRNKKIRLESLKRLGKEKKISRDELQELEKDSFAEIRKEVVHLLISSNHSLSDTEVKNIFIKPHKSGGLGGLLGNTQRDDEGEEYFDEYLFSKYSNMSESKLLEKVEEESFVFDDIPYFALCSRYFRKHSEKLRDNIDDQFKAKFDDYIQHLKIIGYSDEIIKKYQGLENYIRKKLTRKGIDLLCKKGDEKDLNRIRKNMRSENAKSSENEIEYMRNMGEWEDISFIIKAEKDYITRTVLSIFSNYDWYHSIAEAIYKIGRDRLEELLEIEMPLQVLVSLIKICSIANFSQLSHNTIRNLLNSKEDKVRKYAALKSIQAFDKSILESILANYIESEEYRYYNVIFWLDFGVSMPKSITRKAVNHIFNEV